MKLQKILGGLNSLWYEFKHRSNVAAMEMEMKHLPALAWIEPRTATEGYRKVYLQSLAIAENRPDTTRMARIDALCNKAAAGYLGLRLKAANNHVAGADMEAAAECVLAAVSVADERGMELDRVKKLSELISDGLLNQDASAGWVHGGRMDCFWGHMVTAAMRNVGQRAPGVLGLWAQEKAFELKLG